MTKHTKNVADTRKYKMDNSQNAQDIQQATDFQHFKRQFTNGLMMRGVPRTTR